MPSSVSSCHMCHMHSHDPGTLLRTTPLRNSREKSRPYKGKSSSRHPHYHDRHDNRHHNRHHNRGYNSETDDCCHGVRRAHSHNSPGNLARLSDHSHEHNRSNSFSHYQDEISVLPGGNSNTYGRDARGGGGSARSIDGGSVTDHRSNPQPLIIPQQEILVNTLPQPRPTSRSGISSTAGPGGDTSHEYYMQMHRQKVKDEKRKHRFNLQTVMLIGCYVFLFLVAVVIGIVVCYQNGWLGFGSVLGRTKEDNNNLSKGTKIPSSTEIRDRRKVVENEFNLKNNNLPDRPIDSGSIGHNLGGSRAQDRNAVKTGGIFPRGSAAEGKNLHNKSGQRINPSPAPTPRTTTQVNPSRPIFPTSNHPRQNNPLTPSQTQSRTTSRNREREPHPRFPNFITASSSDSSSTRNRPTQNRNVPVRIVDGIIPIGALSNPIIRVQQAPSNSVANRQRIHQTSITRPLNSNVTPTKQNNLLRDSLVNSSPRLFLGQNIVGPANSESFSTQELLDLLAIRRMRELLNSRGNVKNILQLLSNIQPTDGMRLGAIKKEKLDSPITVSANDERSISTNRTPNRINKSPSQVSTANRQNIVSNIDTRTSSSLVNSLANNTVQGAILRLLNNRARANRRRPHGQSRTVTKEPDKLKNTTNLESLQRLFNFANSLNDVQGINSNNQATNTRQRTINNSPNRELVPRRGIPASNTNPLLQFVVGNPIRRANQGVRKPTKDIVRVDTQASSGRMRVPVTNREPNAVNVVPQAINPDPTFAVLVKTGGFNTRKSPKTLNPVFSPTLPSSSRPSETRREPSNLGNHPTPNVQKQSPRSADPVSVREIVAVKSGSTGIVSPDVIRAWTHMDRSGILSRGRIFKGGSFTFSNCKPVEACSKNK